MAAPTGVTAIGDTVIVTLDKPAGVTPTNPQVLTGTVCLIGGGVTFASVGDSVMFIQGTPSPTFSQGGTDSWIAISQNNILLSYIPV